MVQYFPPSLHYRKVMKSFGNSAKRQRRLKAYYRIPILNFNKPGNLAEEISAASVEVFKCWV